MRLDVINRELIAARPVFETISPGPDSMVKGIAARALRTAGTAWFTAKLARRAIKGERVADIAADVASDKAAGKINGKILSRPKKAIRATHLHLQSVDSRDAFRKNGMGGRSWIAAPGNYDLVIIFHDANKAGPHIDIHIGRVSLIRRVKPHIYEQLRFNNDGYLTAASKDVLMEFLRDEIANNSRIPQNLDHTKSNARASWTGGSRDEEGYGAAITRQVVLQDSVYVYKAGLGHPIEFYAPAINPNRGMYVHRLYNGGPTRAPICVWGNLSQNLPSLHDRLHLRLTHPEDLGKISEKVDPATSTAKYDGSSCYFVISKKGTHVYSPRQSKRTGEQIEYTFKIPGVASTYAQPLTDPDGNPIEGTVVGMGELMFTRNGRYLPQAQAGGILNANSVIPDDVTPEIRIYRIDKIGNRKMVDLPFFDNRYLQQQVAAFNPDVLAVVEQMDYDQAIAQGFEGTVSVPQGKSVNDGYKVKGWQEEPHDWRIDEVLFRRGDKGGIAGVVIATSLESGKRFNLGPGQMGNHALCEDMMTDPQDYVGRVIKVKSRLGHEGRASKVDGFHDAKGVW